VKPLCIDLYCGLGGWAEGFLAEGYDCIGFDIERHDYGTGGYPGQLVLQDVLTLHGSQFRNAAVIVASPPCQQYSLWGMRMFYPSPPEPDLTLWRAALRIAVEADVPLIVENVRGAQYFWGRAAWKCGPYYLWGDVPALMPKLKPKRKNMIDDIKNGERRGMAHEFQHCSSKSLMRKRLTAEAAKIPFELSRYVASVYNPGVLA